MIILLRLRVRIKAIKWFLILPILKNGLLLLSNVALHLYLLVQVADIGLSDAFIGHKLLHLSLVDDLALWLWRLAHGLAEVVPLPRVAIQLLRRDFVR